MVLALGGLCLAIGAGLVLAALWIVAAAQFGPVLATMALAGLMLGAGLILLASAPPQPVMPGPADRLRAAAAQGQAFRPTGQMPPLAEAVLFGVSVALQMRARRRP